MARMRVSLADLMAAVLIVGADIAAFRALFAGRRGVEVAPGRFITLVGLACGVLPMASVLVFLGWRQMRAVVRRGGGSAFGDGFQFFGWLAVSGFVALAATSPGGIIAYHDTVASWTLGRFAHVFADVSDLAAACIELTFAAVVLTAPELLVAAAGGWLIRRRRASLGDGDFGREGRAIPASVP